METNIQTVDKLFRDIAEQLGLSASQLFPHLVRVEFIEGISSIVCAIISVIIIIACAKLSIWCANKSKETVDDELYIGGIVLSILIIIIAFVLFVVYIYNGITHILAPEGCAIKEILYLLQ